MVKAIIVIFCSILFVFNSCETCQDSAGKEKIEISQWTEGIDSVKVDDSFMFSKNETERSIFYYTGLINTNETTIGLTVYSNLVVTELELEVKNDYFLYVVLADTSEHLCAGNDSRWETFSKNNIDVCLLYEAIGCP